MTSRRLRRRSDSAPTTSEPIATPSNSTLPCCAATLRGMPYTCCRNGTAHRPAKARKLPPMPMLTKNVGHVLRIGQHVDAAPAATACAAVLAGSAACTGGKPRCSGRSRTMIHAAIPMAMESSPRPTKTVRHDATVTTHASGAPAMTAPKLPANCTTPTSVAKRLAGNHTADDLQQRDECDRDADADQRAADRRDLPRRCQAEQQRSGAGDQRPDGHDEARAERVGHHAHRDLQQRVDEEIGRRKRAEHGAVDRERAGQLAGDGGGRGAVEERQHEAGKQDAEDRAARAFELGLA